MLPANGETWETVYGQQNGTICSLQGLRIGGKGTEAASRLPYTGLTTIWYLWMAGSCRQPAMKERLMKTTIISIIGQDWYILAQILQTGWLKLLLLIVPCIV